MSMTSRTKTIIKLTVVGGLLAVAVAMGIAQMRRFSATGEEALQTWYYDLSEGKLYTVPRDTTPPHKGIGGEKNDGVRTVVVADHGECDDSRKRRIAYLETYTPEHKQLVEDVRAARAAGRAYDQPIPGAESGFYEKNTLVRRVDEPTWHDMTTAEAKRIVAEARGQRGSNGKVLDVCTP
jgi:hypothetical protein